MSEVIVAEGKTTNEAIQNGLKQMKVSRDMVDVKVLEEAKKNFFSILAPRVVKVELTLKKVYEKKEYEVNEKDVEKVRENAEKFINEFIDKLGLNQVEVNVKAENNEVKIDLNGDDVGFLIGYRGECLRSFQTIVSSITNKNINPKVRVIVDIEKYRERREKTLRALATKISKTVLRTGKNITLEPMSAYERKIIHDQLQNNKKITTFSVGEEPNRRVVIKRIDDLNR